MDRRAFIKYRLELEDLTLKNLAEHLDLSRHGLYRKLKGEISTKESEKEKINELLKLTKTESNNLWQKK